MKKIVLPSGSELGLAPHAKTRMQQRGIKDGLVSLVLSRGKIAHSKGRVVSYLDGSSQLSREEFARHGEVLRKRPYVVVGDDAVVTVGWRYKRLKRDFNQQHGQRARRQKRD